jgi:subtilisin family serine protease
MERAQIEKIFYGESDQQRRFTQDFPVLPDVWIKYGANPGKRFELLLTPHSRSGAAAAAQALRERLKAEQEVDPDDTTWKAVDPEEKRARVLCNESVVLASFSFWELMRIAMPLTDWWRQAVAPLGNDWIRQGVEAFLKAADGNKPGRGKGSGGDLRLLIKLIEIAGAIARERQAGLPSGAPGVPSGSGAGKAADVEGQAAAFAGLFAQLTNPRESRGLIWGISVNRPANTSVWRSRMAVKADAASRVFDVNTDGIRWAVLDTGIDARHPAFQRKAGRSTGEDETEATDRPGEFRSRVVATYDFLRIKDLLDPDADTEIPTKNSVAGADPEKLKAFLSDLRSHLARGRALDWQLLEPFLRIPHDGNYLPPPPKYSHGTHVAGILAANWPGAKQTALDQPIQGICPDLEIYDMRVLGPDADEFTVIAALQFVRYLNAHKDLLAVHGVNLSMSVPHDVANYACGRTPVCEECDRVVANGVVVVTAAGNRGFNKLAQPEGGAAGDYRYISITDPGNADSVITVGSTHRFMPHSYGVSYFSSRGPTGDGRTKPDLVAPGERIDSCVPDGDYDTMDGTSMAAPHVSGAAALLIGRYRELIGQPRRVKEILVKSATDLGREPRFQGAGMLDVLRALQSV